MRTGDPVAETHSEEDVTTSPVKPIAGTEPDSATPAKKPPKRCQHKDGDEKCRRKLGLTNRFVCKCDKHFCMYHRHVEDHSCEFDHMGAHKELLRKQNPTIVADKIIKV